MALFIKNNTQSTQVWCGQEITSSSWYQIQDIEKHKWCNNSEFLTALAAEDARLATSQSDNDIIADYSTALAYIRGEDLSPKDEDGFPISRSKITKTGWIFRLHGIQVTTSKLDSDICKKYDNTDFGYTSLKFYELVNSVETEITGENLNQSYLDSNCIKTVLEWEPTHDYEIIGGSVTQGAAPAQDVVLWAIAVPDVPEQYGGSIALATSVNLKFIEKIRMDGRVTKYMTYDSQNHTSKIQITYRHPAGFQHSSMIVFEIFH